MYSNLFKEKKIHTENNVNILHSKCQIKAPGKENFLLLVVFERHAAVG